MCRLWVSQPRGHECGKASPASSPLCHGIGKGEIPSPSFCPGHWTWENWRLQGHESRRAVLPKPAAALGRAGPAPCLDSVITNPDGRGGDWGDVQVSQLPGYEYEGAGLASSLPCGSVPHPHLLRPRTVRRAGSGVMSTGELALPPTFCSSRELALNLAWAA